MADARHFVVVVLRCLPSTFSGDDVHDVLPNRDVCFSLRFVRFIVASCVDSVERNKCIQGWPEKGAESKADVGGFVRSVWCVAQPNRRMTYKHLYISRMGTSIRLAVPRTEKSFADTFASREKLCAGNSIGKLSFEVRLC